MTSLYLDIYDTKNRDCVMRFLTRKYGHEHSVKTYNEKKIDVNDIKSIEQYVLPKPPKPVAELDFTNEQTKLDSIRYMVRMYGEEVGRTRWICNQFSDYDKKMIHTMGRLFDRYNRSCLERLNVNVTEFVEHDLHTTNNKKQAVVMCKAFKMNGDPCSAKAKLNGLCMRHSKKV